MSAQPFAVVCAWCERTLAAAPKGAPVTHTICRPCFEWSVLHPTETQTVSPHRRSELTLGPAITRATR